MARGEAVRRLVPPLAAVTAVVVVILVLLVLNSPSHTSGPDPALQPPRTPTAAAESGSPPVTPSPSLSPSASPRQRAKPHRTAAVAEPPATQAPAVAKVPVTVLNNSRIQHLAAHAAAQLRDGGWPIAAVGNFTGRIAASTVYYPPGQDAQAHLLARQFAAVQRVLPRFEGLPGHGLTLVVTRYWPHDDP